MRHGLGLRPATGGAGALTRGGAVDHPEGAGRWSLLPAREAEPTLRAHAMAAQLLDRHGVLTRAVARAEGISGQFGPVYRVLAGLEAAGTIRRGYFVEHLGGSQFAVPGAVDLLRETGTVLTDAAADMDVPATRAEAPTVRTVFLAATDPANPYGAALAWPPNSSGHRPGRTAGALVVLADGVLALYVERGGRTVLSFTADARILAGAAAALAKASRAGASGRLTLQRLDGAALVDRGTLATRAGTALVAAGFTLTPRGLRTAR